MLRSNTLYRRLWYVRKRNIKRLHLLFRLAAAMLILTVLGSLIFGQLIPSLQRASELEIHTFVTSLVNDTVRDVNQSYNVLITSRDTNGSITSIEVDSSKLNRLSALVSDKLRERLGMPDARKISIPAGNMFTNNFLSGTGPGLNIGLQQAGSIETGFTSEFVSDDINRIIHRICLEVSIKINYSGPIFAGSTMVTDIVPVAESVIVDRIPEI